MKVIIQKTIEEKLQQLLNPTYLKVINESHQHNVPTGSESHFKVVVVSEVFDGLRAVQRQQHVYKALSDEMAGGVHALTMQTLTPQEWAVDNTLIQSPPCLGGSSSS